MACKGILKYTVKLPVELIEDNKVMIREVVVCSLDICPKSRGKFKITERCWREPDKTVKGYKSLRN